MFVAASEQAAKDDFEEVGKVIWRLLSASKGR